MVYSSRSELIIGMKSELTKWLLIACLGVTAALSGLAAGEGRIVCYHTSWSFNRGGLAKFTPQNINPYLCTHLIFAYGSFTDENTLVPFNMPRDIDKAGFAEFTGLKDYNPKLKTMIGIGGGIEGSGRFSRLAADAGRRRELALNAVKFMRENNFDGLDLVWHYPTFRGGMPMDRANHAQLVQELRQEFDTESRATGRPRLLLTMAIPARIEYIDNGYDVRKLNRYLDWISVLCYDYHLSVDPEVDHHSPLYAFAKSVESNYKTDNELNTDFTIKHLLKTGADRDKLVLAISTFGRAFTLFNPDSTDIGARATGPGEPGEATWEKGFLAYFEICAKLMPKTDANRQVNDEKAEGWTVVHPDARAMGPYAYKGRQWVGYDDVDSVKMKAEYVVEQGLGGIMFWTIDQDDFRGKCHGKPYPLIEAAKEALYKGLSSRKSPAATLGWALNTPEPPITPDPRKVFKCEEEGFFPHPHDCEKYFLCLGSGGSIRRIIAYELECPSVNIPAGTCNSSSNPLCNPVKTTVAPRTSTTTETPTTSESTERSSAITKTPTSSETIAVPKTKTPTTSKTTLLVRGTTVPVSAEEKHKDRDKEKIDSEEDPKVIKELEKWLAKKIGGTEQAGKHLSNIGKGNQVTNAITPAEISTFLLERIFSLMRSNGERNQLIQGVTAASSSEKTRKSPTGISSIFSPITQSSVITSPKHATVSHFSNPRASDTVETTIYNQNDKSEIYDINVKIDLTFSIKKNKN